MKPNKVRPLWPWAVGTLAGTLLLVTGLSAVGSADRPDGPCEEAVSAAASVPAGDNADRELRATTTACASVAEWEAAMRQHPAAMGLTDGSYINPTIDLLALCNQGTGRAVCDDARSRGVLE